MGSLEDVVNSLRESYTEIYHPHSLTGVIPLTEELGVLLKKPTARAILMGRFYEHLTAALYGGDVCISEILPGGDEDENDTITPDVVNNSTKRYFEVKGVCAGQHCMLQDYQLDHYEQLLRARPGYDLSFAFFRHTLHGIKSTWSGNSEQLLSELAAKTLYLVVLPYSAITQMHGMVNGSKALVSRFQKEGSPFDRCTSVLASTLTRLYTKPEEVVEQVAGEDVSRYTLSRYVSAPISLSGFLVPAFPIVLVEDTMPVRYGALVDGSGSFDDDVPF